MISLTWLQKKSWKYVTKGLKRFHSSIFKSSLHYIYGNFIKQGQIVVIFMKNVKMLKFRHRRVKKNILLNWKLKSALLKNLIKKAFYMQNPKKKYFLGISQPKKQTEAITCFSDLYNKKSAIFEISQKKIFCLKDIHLDYFVAKNHKDRVKIVILMSIFWFFFQNHDFPEISAKILKWPYLGR